MTPRLAQYIRLSEDQDGSVSLESQQAAGVEYIEQAWGGRAIFDPTLDVYVDEYISAGGSKYRPQLEALMRRVKDGRYDGIVTREWSRMSRNGRESLRIAALMQESACEIHCWMPKDQILKLHQPWAGIIFQLFAMMAESELLALRERVVESHKTRAQHGYWRTNIPTFGMRRRAVETMAPNGKAETRYVLEPDYTPIEGLQARLDSDGNPVEGAADSPGGLLLDAAQRVIRGEKTIKIAQEWNARGVPTSSTLNNWNRRGKPAPEWRDASLRRVLTSPTIAGYHVYKGEIAKDSAGEPVRPNIPLVDDLTWTQLQQRLTTKGERRRLTESLLRRIVYCAHCGGTMSPTGPRADVAKDYERNYVCVTRQRRRDGCVGCGINRPKLEDYITQWVIAVLRDPELLAALRQEAHPRPTASEAAARASVIAMEKQDIRTRLDRIEQMALDGEFDDADGKQRKARLKEPLTRRLDELIREENKQPTVSSLDKIIEGFSGEDPASVWPTLTDGERRTIIWELIEYVKVSKATKRAARIGQPVFDDTRIEIVWRTAQPVEPTAA